MGMENEEFCNLSRIEPELIYLRKHIGKDIAHGSVNHDGAIPALKIIGSCLLTAEVPQIICNLSCLSESHLIAPPIADPVLWVALDLCTLLIVKITKDIKQKTST